MNIIAVDDDRASLDRIKRILKKTAPDASCLYFDSSLSALAHVRENEADVAILEVETPELTGIDLGRYLKELNPYINLVYHTQDTSYAYDAMKLHASGFIKKPCTEKDLRTELESLRYTELRKKHKRVFAQTFGNFELFVDQVPVEFKYKRTKEVVAILINNRGAQTTNGELIACLWEDEGDPEKRLSYLGNLRQDLQNTLSRYKLNDIIFKQRGSMAIAVDRIECDLYEWLDKRDDSKYNYMGDYMNQYSWAEDVHAGLDELVYEDWDEDQTV